MGVWVGRDVRHPDAAAAPDVAAADNTGGAVPPPTQVSPSDLDYNARLNAGAKPPAASSSSSASSGDAPKTQAEPPQTPPTPPAEPPTPVSETPVDVKDAPKAAAAPKPEKAPAKGGLSLQVGAFSDARAANTLASKLKAKGYAAYVFTAPSGPVRHKVRVGPFADRADADRTSAKLKKEEGLSPLVTR
jgi:DedD protein